MIENQQENYQENQIESQIKLEQKINLKRAITEKTRTETLAKGLNAPLDSNNLNSVLKNPDDKIINYINVPRTETEVLGQNKMSKDISPNEEEKNKNKLCSNTNIKKESKKNIDISLIPQRLDRYNCPITKKGKQKVTYIDKVTKNKLTQIIDIESFKEYNKMVEIKSSSSQKHTCCVII